GMLGLPDQDFGIDHALGSLTAQVCCDGVGRVANGGVDRSWCTTGGVRREDDIRQLVESGVARWLDLAYVERRTRNLVRLQCGIQGIFIDERTTRGVDEIRTRLHQAKKPRIDHSSGLR